MRVTDRRWRSCWRTAGTASRSGGRRRIRGSARRRPAGSWAVGQGTATPPDSGPILVGFGSAGRRPAASAHTDRVADREFEDLLRELAPQVLGAVVRRYGHFDTAEDATQEALVAAAVQWPIEGIPDNPRGWLITVASRRLTDLLRADE